MSGIFWVIKIISLYLLCIIINGSGINNRKLSKCTYSLVYDGIKMRKDKTITRHMIDTLNSMRVLRQAINVSTFCI